MFDIFENTKSVMGITVFIIGFNLLYITLPIFKCLLLLNMIPVTNFMLPYILNSLFVHMYICKLIK